MSTCTFLFSIYKVSLLCLPDTRVKKMYVSSSIKCLLSTMTMIFVDSLILSDYQSTGNDHNATCYCTITGSITWESRIAIKVNYVLSDRSYLLLRSVNRFPRIFPIVSRLIPSWLQFSALSSRILLIIDYQHSLLAGLNFVSNVSSSIPEFFSW